METKTEIAGSRRQQAEERREQILDAALGVFSEKGFAGASIRDIARAAGVTDGLIYHYFDGKEQLEEACWKERSWRAHLERILANADNVSLETVLRELLNDFLQTMYDNGPVFRMCVAEMQRNNEIAAYHLQRMEETLSLFHDFLIERQRKGEIRPDANVKAAAGLLMGCAHSLFLLWGRSEPKDWKPLANLLIQEGVDIVMHGVAP
jgi:AcrR family transcriptional regulator